MVNVALSIIEGKLMTLPLQGKSELVTHTRGKKLLAAVTKIGRLIKAKVLIKMFFIVFLLFTILFYISTKMHLVCQLRRIRGDDRWY